MSTEQPSLRKGSDKSLNELEKEFAVLCAGNHKPQRVFQGESLRHEAREELINLAKSTYHIKVRKDSDAKQSTPCHRGILSVMCATICSSFVITSA